ncbi:elongation factor P maturation arginine rhamnosyltransferase EarP [Rheinheimera baltica]|uniref:Protein-arginine rhamnosyltransferase n=1 Tax=Rheinheimera baltica TaxID=67576 RepID=A0ABT9HYF8_9GAMM|nr:elongation factor P maturation arginine rhamnosyltransferase EarP [Rheinheimera baltica]MDP5136179.1 elongation factor P maturation arginine rhamnosyltransferase EarP [Rheinheimera baltica]
MPDSATRWDIFCAVIDNFGDIGICWRLSRQLVQEHNVAVRLWVDDLQSFQRICPQIDIHAEQQQLFGVNIVHWSSTTDWVQVGIAKVVIEALACTIPLAYQQHMAQEEHKPLWLNLEYLSAEEWVEGCHALPSPQPHLPLDKYFFFPGFTANTGGLLQEATLQQQAEAFMQDAQAQQAFWQHLDVHNSAAFQQKISLFGYDHPQLASLLTCWQQAAKSTLCLVPEGVLAKQLSKLYPELAKQGDCNLGNLRLKVLPFMPQDHYDKLLWACDINFVRGEDSIIRAHWAAKPFIWQIYRQAEQAHLEKLDAFVQRYTQLMPSDVAKALTEFWRAWNTDNHLAQSWQKFSAILLQIAEYNQLWRAELTANGDLASNLVHFVEKKFIMRRNFS